MFPKEVRTRRPSSRIDYKTSLKRPTTNYHGNESSSKKSKSFYSESVDSDISLPFEARTWKDVKQKLEFIGWIQCDNADCRKWRKCPREELANIPDDAKWYCTQNSDPLFSSCSVPEEDTHFYDQLAVRSGLVYLKSELELGTLVWARIPGYCSWPGIITKDPGTGKAVEKEKVDDGEDEISHYHVEFLGKPHTHSWVCARHVKVFVASPTSEQRSTKKTTMARGRGKCAKRRGRPFSMSGPNSKAKTMYKNGVSVDDGIAEAVKLLPLLPSERLKHSVYFYVDEVHHMPSNCAANARGTAVCNDHKSTTSYSQAQTKVDCEASMKAEVPKTSPTSTHSSLSFTDFSSSLENRTKEERLMLDVEMYRRNEHAFDHDVTRFMLRNKLKVMVKGPFWQNQRISLFHLFLTVHERGGYQQVTNKRGWAAVYREVTDMASVTEFSYSACAKSYYYKYLYPYELYIHGKDFRDYIEVKDRPSDDTQSRKKRRRRKGKENTKANMEHAADHSQKQNENCGNSLHEVLSVR